ncbi:YciI family protein [Kushneria sp. AK178]
MKQFTLVARDHTDEGALERRMGCREAHLDGLRRLYQQGHFVSGGVMLDDDGKMIGSNAHFRFESRDAMDAWLETEPYVTERVWEHIEIHEIKLFDPNA